MLLLSDIFSNVVSKVEENLGPFHDEIHVLNNNNYKTNKYITWLSGRFCLSEVN